eukprot:gene4675-biopygen4688
MLPRHGRRSASTDGVSAPPCGLRRGSNAPGAARPARAKASSGEYVCTGASYTPTTVYERTDAHCRVYYHVLPRGRHGREPRPELSLFVPLYASPSV